MEERTTTNILLSELQTKKERLVIQLHTVKHHQHNHGWNRQRQGPEKGYMYMVNVHHKSNGKGTSQKYMARVHENGAWHDKGTWKGHSIKVHNKGTWQGHIASAHGKVTTWQGYTRTARVHDKGAWRGYIARIDDKSVRQV